MKELTTARRGRPPNPTDHPVGSRARQRREELGLTVRDVAVLAGLRVTSASYVSQLESGAKTPHPTLARRLAEALRDDPRIYLAWAATSRRSDPIETARAVRILADLLRHPRYELTTARPGIARPFSDTATAFSHPARDLPTLEPRRAADAVPAARLLVPELEEGADPGLPGRAEPRPIATHRIAPEALAAIEPLVRPFAYRLTEASARRVRDILQPGQIVLLTRRGWPVEPGDVCGVRLSGHVTIARLLWNERQLLLLPAPGASDFIVVEAPDRRTVECLLVGRLVATVQEES